MLDAEGQERGMANRSAVVAMLRAVLPPGALITDDEELRAYECDGLSAYRRLPGVVALPETTEQVQEILRICHREQIPVVARGAGTGLSGGALPLSDGLLLSLARFKEILAVDPVAMTATVQPGVRNLAISEAVAEHGLFYAPDPSSQIACSIGGNVAENSGGVHCLKYGLTVHNIQAVEMITMEGERLRLGGDTLDTPGFDLLSVLTGSEGLLGIIVEVTVKLLPKPPEVQVLMAAFDEVANAARAVTNVISAGIIPAGLEMMDKLAVQAAEDFVHAGYPRDAEAILICEIDGDEAELAAIQSRVEKVLKDSGASEVRCASSEAEKALFWKGRKAAFPAVGRLAPDYYCMDGTIPRHQLAAVLQRIHQLSEEYGLPVANVFHAGDGNLHPLILYDANQNGELEKAETLGGKILELCIEMGGTITGEHGVGVEKLREMCVQFSAEELEQFHAVKHAFDESGLLNPGKAIPTLQRCAEFGAMHVHHNQLPFPELERF